MKIKNIIKSSTKAICGAFEREIIVDRDEVSLIKSKLKDKGYMIVGTGDAGFKKKKIWFNPKGMLL